MSRPEGWSSNPEGDNPDHWVRVDPPYTNKWVEVRSSYYGDYLEPDQLDAMAAELTKSAAWIRQHQAESGQHDE